jgi:hypothetical protein
VEAFNIGPYLDWLAEKRTPELGVKPDHPDYQANVHAIAYEGREQLMKMITGTLAAFNQGRSERTPEPKFEFHEASPQWRIPYRAQGRRLVHHHPNHLPRIPLSIRDWHTNNRNQPSAFHPLTRS